MAVEGTVCGDEQQESRCGASSTGFNSRLSSSLSLKAAT